MDTRNACILGGCLIISAIIIAIGPRFASRTGRYQLGSAPGHAYVIDTVTGQVWEKYAPASEGANDPNFNSRK